jgi:death on curing protein
MTEYLTVAEVVDINRKVNDIAGGFHAVEEKGNLAYCVETVRDTGEDISDPRERIALKTAALLLCVGRAHIFLDGNKRTTYGAAHLFVKANGHQLRATTREAIRLTLDIQGGRMSQKAVLEWVRAHLI